MIVKTDGSFSALVLLHHLDHDRDSGTYVCMYLLGYAITVNLILILDKLRMLIMKKNSCLKK